MQFSQKMPLCVFYTMVQKNQKWPKTQIKGGPALSGLNFRFEPLQTAGQWIDYGLPNSGVLTTAKICFRRLFGIVVWWRTIKPPEIVHNMNTDCKINIWAKDNTKATLRKTMETFALDTSASLKTNNLFFFFKANKEQRSQTSPVVT